MNDELESHVLQRTKELEAANQRLSQAQAELAHINRKELVRIFDPPLRQQAMPLTEPFQELRCLRTMRPHR